MTESQRVRPALTSSRLGIGLTTVALVALASAGTGYLVSHGTKQLAQSPRTHVPSAVPDLRGPSAPRPVLVDRAPGSFALPTVVIRPAGAPPAAEPTLPPPFTPLPEAPLGPDVVPPVTPDLTPPDITAPDVEPPVVARREPSFVPGTWGKAHKPTRDVAGRTPSAATEPWNQPRSAYGAGSPSHEPHQPKAKHDNGNHAGQGNGKHKGQAKHRD